MTDFLSNSKPLFDFFLLSIGFAYSQQITLRAGVFSVATAAFAAIGAYTTAILVQRAGIGMGPALIAATINGGLTGYFLAVPLARLRGVFQAIATLAFVEIVVSLAYYLKDITGGALGLYNIPKLIDTPHLLVAACLVIYFMWAISQSGIGRAFDAIRQDEAVGAVLGVSITRYHRLAFVLSGTIGATFGGLQSLYTYSIEPQMFGFGFLVAVLTYIIIGGRRSVMGPIAGSAIMIALPEVIRPLADNRQFVQGAIMIAVIVFLPHGVVDGALMHLRHWWSALRAKEHKTV